VKNILWTVEMTMFGLPAGTFRRYRPNHCHRENGMPAWYGSVRAPADCDVGAVPVSTLPFALIMASGPTGPTCGTLWIVPGEVVGAADGDTSSAVAAAIRCGVQ
jgi:hypothetical protein